MISSASGWSNLGGVQPSHTLGRLLVEKEGVGGGPHGESVLHVLQNLGCLAGLNGRSHEGDKEDNGGDDSHVEGVAEIILTAGDDEDVAVVQPKENQGHHFSHNCTCMEKEDMMTGV